MSVCNLFTTKRLFGVESISKSVVVKMAVKLMRGMSVSLLGVGFSC